VNSVYVGPTDTNCLFIILQNAGAGDAESLLVDWVDMMFTDVLLGDTNAVHAFFKNGAAADQAEKVPRP
jgi:hypothetical protein